MLATRVLTAADVAVNRRAQSGFEISSPLEFELNRLLLPKYDRLPRQGDTVILERPLFDNMYKKAIKDTRPHLSPRTPREQRELFRQDFRVFISMPYDTAVKDRTTVLRKSINRLYKEKTSRDGGEGVSYVDIHFIPHVGPFRSEIPVYIRDSTYVVADISDVAVSQDKVPGVFYEIGLAIGERKPIALFYNCRGSRLSVPVFKTEFLPAVLRGESVLTWDKKTQSFHEEFRRVHEKLTAYNGVWEPTRISAEQRRFADEKGKFAYLSFEPRNHAAGEWFGSLVKRLFPELRIEATREWGTDDLYLLHEIISNAALCIIDCTGRINAQALELGIAAAVEQGRVPCVVET